MNPKQFLTLGGAVLLLLGIVGLLGIFTKENTPFFWLDSGENWAHIFLGAVALAAVYVPGLNTALAPYYKLIVTLVGVLALFFGAYGFIVAGNAEPNTLGVANLESPFDNLLHLAVGIWALWAAYNPMAQKDAASAAPSM